MTPANDNVPRLMTKTEACAYCGVSLPTFGKWVAKGLLPQALPVRKWDRKAIDLALDKMGGLIVESHSKEDEVDKWFRENGY